jgi:hypothetical protein
MRGLGSGEPDNCLVPEPAVSIAISVASVPFSRAITAVGIDFGGDLKNWNFMLWKIVAAQNC